MLLRNAKQSTMSTDTGDPFWFDRLGLRPPELDSVNAARAKVSRNGHALTASRIVSELHLGFWAALAGRHYAASLWVPYLHKAFPNQRLGQLFSN